MNSYKNVSDLINSHIGKDSGSIAIATEFETITYKQLDNYVSNVAALFNKKNINPGDIVALTFNNQLSFIISMLAVARIGATLFSLSNTTAPLMKKELLKRVNAKFIVTDIPSILNKHRELTNIFIDNKDIKKKHDSTIYIPAPEAPWQIILGSGSTGKSKLIPITHEQEIARTFTPNDSFHIQKGDRVASLINIHFSDTKRRFLETIAAKATFVFRDNKKIDLIEMYKKLNVNILRSTVFHIEHLLTQLPKDTKNFFGFLKVLSVGTSVVSEKLRERIYNHLTPNLYITYGTNETGTLTALNPFNTTTVPGSVGKPFDGIEIEIVDHDDKILLNDTVGLIRIKSKGTVNHYMYDEEATQDAFKNGWFYPGDLGKLTDDGQLVYMGRSDHMMIMDGINIYPSEIERVITSHPDVKDAAAMPIKSTIHQDIPICAVVLENNSIINEKGLIDYSIRYLGSSSPRRVIILDEIPRNEQGKLIRSELKKYIEDKLNRI